MGSSNNQGGNLCKNADHPGKNCAFVAWIEGVQQHIWAFLTLRNSRPSWNHTNSQIEGKNFISNYLVGVVTQDGLLKNLFIPY